MTHEEIIRSLRCCAEMNCSGNCPVHKNCKDGGELYKHCKAMFSVAANMLEQDGIELARIREGGRNG